MRWIGRSAVHGFRPQCPALIRARATTQPANVETGTLAGAAYRIDIPAKWNHGLAYFHG
jgi:hypothetical protein